MWPQLIADYLTVLAAAGQRPATIRLRRHQLLRFATAYPDPAVSGADVVEYLSRVDWQPETRRAARSALVCFYRWAHKAGSVAADPCLDLASVRVPRAVPRPCPDVIYRSALAVADVDVRLMMRLCAEAGLRRGEVAAVHGTDLSPEGLYVAGKGGQMRVVPLTDSLRAEVAAAGRGFLFPGRSGHLTPNHVGKVIAAALPDGWTAHTLRHRFATRAYTAGHDLLAVQQLLGHASPVTTQRYVGVEPDSLFAAVTAAA